MTASSRKNQADLGDALSDRDPHHREDSDRTDEERDSGDEADREGDAVDHLAKDVEHGRLGGDREILVAAVAVGEEFANLFFDDVDQAPVREGHIDFAEIVHVEHPHREGDGDVDGVIEIEAERVALGRHDSDHAKSRVRDSNHLSECVLITEEFALHLRTEHCDRAGATRIGVVHELTLADLELPDLGK
jgi:hypothetical protein